MSARPIVAGRSYRVAHAGRLYYVLAPHPCDAICAVLAALEGRT